MGIEGSLILTLDKETGIIYDVDLFLEHPIEYLDELKDNLIRFDQKMRTILSNERQMLANAYSVQSDKERYANVEVSNSDILFHYISNPIQIVEYAKTILFQWKYPLIDKSQVKNLAEIIKQRRIVATGTNFLNLMKSAKKSEGLEFKIDTCVDKNKGLEYTYNNIIQVRKRILRYNRELVSK